MARKNLNDAIRGDRASIRGNRGGIKPSDSWEALEAKQSNDKNRQQFLDGMFGPGAPDPEYRAAAAPKGNTKNFVDFERCYHKHQPLKLPGTELVIYGGSCLEPAVDDADVYVGFDQGMRFTQRHWPWKKGTELRFTISDMGVPKSPEDFLNLLSFVTDSLKEGLKVHCGCIGGHGRTGMFFAALVAQHGEPDAITYVREHYCSKVVESTTQVDYLHKHFGVKRVVGSKSNPPAAKAPSAPSWSSKTASPGVAVPSVVIEKIQPMKGQGSVWGD